MGEERNPNDEIRFLQHMIKKMQQRINFLKHTSKKQKKKKKGIGKQLYPESSVLACYKTITVYEPILQHVLNRVGDEFICSDVCNALQHHHETKMNRKLSDTSAKIMACYYLKYLVKENIVVGFYSGHCKRYKRVKKNDLFDDGIVLENGIFESYKENKAESIRENLDFVKEVCR